MLLLVACTGVSAQVIIDTVPFPAGFTHYELRERSVLKVDPANGDLWIGFKSIGAGKLDATGWTLYDTTNSPLRSNNIKAISFADDEIWLGSTAGIVKFDGTNWTLYNKLNSGFLADTVTCMEWKDGILWVGTYKGLFSFDGTLWKRFHKGNSILSNDSITCLAIDQNNIVWLGTKNGLFRIIAGQTSFYGLGQSYHLTGYIKKLAVDASNAIWLENGLDQNPGAFDKEPNYLIRNEELTSTNKLFDSYCIGFPVNPFIICPSNNGGMWVISDNVGYTTNSFVYDVRADIPDFTRYSNLINYRELFTHQNLTAQDKTGMFWSTKAFAMLNDNNLLKIHLEGFVTPDNTDFKCYQLDINQVRTRISPDGNSHWDNSNDPKYEVPKGSGKNAIFCNGLWIGGLDASNNLHLAAATYRQSGSDYWPGPLDTLTASIDSITQAKFDRVWRVNKSDIDDFALEFTRGNVNNGSYRIPTDIAEWPGNGTGNYSRQMAPYIDFNKDGTYNPYDGDRPDIKGDQYLWWVFNDNFKPHTQTLGARLGLEIRGCAYAWNCDGNIGPDSIRNYTTFYEFEFINRTDSNYHDMFTGIFTDAELGNYLDNYLGSDPNRNNAFAYNGDSIDDGFVGYGTNPPMINYRILKGPLAVENDGKDNDHDGLVDEEAEQVGMTSFLRLIQDFTWQGFPSMALHYYLFMQSRWKDSSHLTYGGSGYGGTIPVNFMLTGIPYDTGWADINMPQNHPGQSRWIASSGPFNLPAHESRSLAYAYIYSRYPNAPNGLHTSIAQNNFDIDRINSMWKSNTFPCSNKANATSAAKSKDQLQVYPNPTRGFLIVSKEGNWEGKAKWRIVNPIGQLIREGDFQFSGANTISLPFVTNGIYFLSCEDAVGTYVSKFMVE